jgi:hypothetical protein
MAETDSGHQKENAYEMAPDYRDSNRSAFRPEDELDEVFGGGGHNSDRAHCPEDGVLRAAGMKALPIDHAVYEHLTECSACYQRFRYHQRSIRRAARFRTALAVAAGVSLVLVAAAYMSRGLREHLPASTARQALLIDYREENTTRSDAGDSRHQPVRLPRANLNATFLLPIGSEPGNYEVRLVDKGNGVRMSKVAAAELKNFAVRIEVELDLQSFARGTYLLEWRRLGEDWEEHPVVIR